MGENPTVADFARKFGIGEADLERVPWAKHARINIPSIGSLHDFKFNKEYQALEDFLSKMKNGGTDTSSPMYIKLDHMMRPDALHFKQINENEYFSILLSAKFFNDRGVPSSKAISDLHSTNFNKVYYDSNGDSVNDKKRKDHDLWQSVLQQYSSFNHVGSLRLHILLPHVQGSQPQCRVEGEDIILYVNSTNLETIFDKDAQNLLSIACKPLSE
eukprot:TRINITY_DN4898_c1_g1_i1.p2 TRINITY_DN4898_c1_g1~~TRINITY_DN4898_c1_g1_i1.p2  ORF type:complete len:215 (-),score=31.09 TRINITY_DN4898_c1_g1_i1:31-675(-)